LQFIEAQLGQADQSGLVKRLTGQLKDTRKKLSSLEADFLLCKQDLRLSQISEIRVENDTYKRELIRLRQMLEFEMRNKISSHVTSAVSNKSLEQNSIVAAEAQKLKDNYAKLRKANIEQSKQILKLSDSLLKAES